MKRLLLSLTMIAAGLVISQAAALAANTLGPGESIRKGEYRVSTNGKYELILQYDGNLVLYRLSDRRALWATGTNSSSPAASVSAVMQTDGNLVMYVNTTGFSTPIWASNTNQNGRSGVLVLQDDGNLVIY